MHLKSSVMSFGARPQRASKAKDKMFKSVLHLAGSRRRKPALYVLLDASDPGKLSDFPQCNEALRDISGNAVVGAEISGYLLPSMPQSEEGGKKQCERTEWKKRRGRAALPGGIPGLSVSRRHKFWLWQLIPKLATSTCPDIRSLAHRAASHVSIRLSHLRPDVFDSCLFIAIAAAAEPHTPVSRHEKQAGLRSSHRDEWTSAEED